MKLSLQNYDDTRLRQEQIIADKLYFCSKNTFFKFKQDFKSIFSDKIC